jgi:hypothetical protein
MASVKPGFEHLRAPKTMWWSETDYETDKRVTVAEKETES